MNVNTTMTMFSSKAVTWGTPRWLFDDLNAQYGFSIDVTATKDNTLCETYFDKDVDALQQDWFGFLTEKGLKPVCWMNPPYSRILTGRFIKKAYEESLKGCTVVCLIPSRTDTKWWHEYCLKGAITFIKGRLRFNGAKTSAPFPSALVVFTPLSKGKGL